MSPDLLAADVRTSVEAAVSDLFVMQKTLGEDDYWASLATIREHAPVRFCDEGGFWLVTGFKECQAVFMSRSAKMLFEARYDAISPGWRSNPARVSIGEWFNSRDGQAHADIRRPMNDFFLPNAVEAFRPRVKAVVRDIVRQFKALGGGDFLNDVAFQMTTRITSLLLDVSEDNYVDFKPLIKDFMTVFELDLSEEGWKHANGAAVKLRQFWRSEVRKRFDAPDGDGIISQLIRRRVFSEEQTVIIAENLLAAAFETTANSSANGLYMMLRNPDQLVLARGDPQARATVADELLRLASAASIVSRQTDAPIRIGDVTIPEGSTVLIAFGAANRDPSIFPDADRLIFGRSERRSLAFGGGVHNCLGEALARIILSSLYDEIFEQWHQIALVGPAPKYHGLTLRMLDQLNIAVA